MTAVRSWLLAVIAVSLLCAVADALMPQGAIKRVGKLVCGLVLIGAVLSPGASLDAEEGQRWLDSLTPEEARKYMDEGQFAPGSMLPKVQAAVRFAESRPGRKALITLLEKAGAGVAGETGTTITL